MRSIGDIKSDVSGRDRLPCSIHVKFRATLSKFSRIQFAMSFVYLLLSIPEVFWCCPYLPVFSLRVTYLTCEQLNVLLHLQVDLNRKLLIFP